MLPLCWQVSTVNRYQQSTVSTGSDWWRVQKQMLSRKWIKVFLSKGFPTGFKQYHQQQQTTTSLFFPGLSSKEHLEVCGTWLVSGTASVLITQARCCGCYWVSGSKCAKFTVLIHWFWCQDHWSGISPHLLIKAFKSVSTKVGMYYFLGSVSWKHL